MTSHEIRKAFLDFFKSKQHKIVPSAPLVLKNDPTLMFTNSGMVQFKDYFLGNGTPPAVRIADTQKCLRVSGKHNDLEDVGFDGTHHTMFEMLGNWSFGDYFKEDAIAWSWELLHTVLGLPADRLYATVFGGDEKDGLASDEEARSYWLKYLPANQILDGNKKDNFWEMGAQGPCGPCSEIHFDFRSDEERAKVPGETLVNMDDPSVVEIWNNVFMQFERKADGSLVVLPAQHVDTGMGFERLCLVLQGKKYTYDTDIFTPFIQFIEKESGKTYTGSYSRDAKTDVAMRVVADHIRAVAFTIADGQMPAAGGAGYVIRRILRRAVRYSYSFLDIKEPFFNKLVPLLANEFADVFPELKAQEAFVQKVILEEEKSFLRTLELGLKRFETLNTEGGIVKGVEAFELFDTYGFPVDLTQLIASERGLRVDTEGFDVALKEQKARSKKDAEKQVGDWVVVIDEAGVEFVGYTQLKVENAKVLKYRAVKDKKGLQYQIVLNRTPFYAESGGQVGDTGAMYFDGEKIDVLDTKKENDLVIHIVSELPENIRDPRVRAQVDRTRRAAISKNHTGVHLMHAALHLVLGKHALQKGQSVDDNRLRFDFQNSGAVTKEELATIELMVNQKIRENIALDEQQMSIEAARQTGAMMLFGEKYGETVRVITFDPDFSRELCGGTHVAATGEIGLFKIVSEAAVGAGVRRIEAVTADGAEAYLNNELAELNRIRVLLRNPKDIQKAVSNLQEQQRLLVKKHDEYLENLASEYLEKENLLNQFEYVNDILVLTEHVKIDNLDIVKTLSANLAAKKNENCIILLASQFEGKTHLTLRISNELVDKYSLKAGIIMRELASILGGGGGGQNSFATGNGTDSTKLDEVFRKIREKVPPTENLLLGKIFLNFSTYVKAGNFSNNLFSKFVKQEYDAHFDDYPTEAWKYYIGKGKTYIREKILGRGQADFTKPYNDGSEHYLPQYDMIDLYCYYYMQMHYASSVSLFKLDNAKQFWENNFLNKKIVFIDFGCGPFTTGAAFLAYYASLDKTTPLNMNYIGMDIAEEMLEKAQIVANLVDNTKGNSSFQFVNDDQEVVKLVKESLKDKVSNKAVIINLCYLLAAPYFSAEENLDQFAHILNEIIDISGEKSICLIYQNPDLTNLHNNWEKLKTKLSFKPKTIRGGKIDYSFDDLTGSWKPNYMRPTRRVYFELYFNETV